MSATYTVDERKVIYADLDPKEGVVLNLDTKNYYCLNETGQLVWQGIAAGKSPETIAKKLSEVYDVPWKAALADVKEILSQMEREHLVRRCAPE